MSSKCFNPFYYTKMSCDSCWEAMESAPSADASDAVRGDHCARECQWLCWPVIFTFDIASCPCRCGNHYAKKYCKCYKKKTCCNPHPNITIQPM